MRLSDLDEVIARLDESSFHSNPTLAAECVDAALARLRKMRANAVAGCCDADVDVDACDGVSFWEDLPGRGMQGAVLILTPREER